MIFVWQNTVKSLHNKLLTTDLFLFRTSGEKVSADEQEEEGLGVTGSSDFYRRYARKKIGQTVSRMQMAFLLRRMGT